MDGINFIDDFYYKNLPDDFYEKMVELENAHQKNKYFGGFSDIKVIEELTLLYKQGVEYFCVFDKEKENYFYEKMQNLLSNEKVIKIMEDNLEKENHIPSRSKRSHTVFNNNNKTNNLLGADSNLNSTPTKNNNIPIKRKFSYGKQKKFKTRNSMQFKMIMNKIASKKEKKIDIEDLKKETEKNYEKGYEIYNNNMEEQEKNFKENLEKIKKKRRRFSSALLDSNELNTLNINTSTNNNNNLTEINSPNKTRRKDSTLSSRKFSRLSSGKFELESSDKKEDISAIANNYSLSFVSRRKKSINYFIDNYLIWFFHKYFDKFSSNILKKILKKFERNYLNKKGIYLQYEEELSSFGDIQEKNNSGKNEEIGDKQQFDEGIRLIVDSLLMEKKEKFDAEDLRLFEEMKLIAEKGKNIEICNEEEFNKSINDLTNKIMEIFI